MRITEKGQVTIPKAIRDRLGVGPGSEVDFVERESGVVLEVAGSARNGQAPNSFEDWADGVAGLLDLEGRTTDEHMDWLRGPRDDLDPR